MPRKSDKIPINNEKLDRRIKLTASDKATIKLMYTFGPYSQRQLASMFGVSRRSIVFAIYPERKAENVKRREERGGSKQYYDKAKNTKAMREHRDYKKELYRKGLIGTAKSKKESPSEDFGGTAENKNAGQIVETKSGLTGRIYNHEGLIKGKMRVYTQKGKLLCDPKTLKVTGFID